MLDIWSLVEFWKYCTTCYSCNYTIFTILDCGGSGCFRVVCSSGRFAILKAFFFFFLSVLNVTIVSFCVTYSFHFLPSHPLIWDALQKRLAWAFFVCFFNPRVFRDNRVVYLLSFTFSILTTPPAWWLVCLCCILTAILGVVIKPHSQPHYIEIVNRQEV